MENLLIDTVIQKISKLVKNAYIDWSKTGVFTLSGDIKIWHSLLIELLNDERKANRLDFLEEKEQKELLSSIKNNKIEIVTKYLGNSFMFILYDYNFYKPFKKSIKKLKKLKLKPKKWDERILRKHNATIKSIAKIEGSIQCEKWLNSLTENREVS